MVTIGHIRRNAGLNMAWRFLLMICGLWTFLISPGYGFDRYTAHGGPVRGLALSPDGSKLVTASFDYSAVVWGAKALQEQLTLLGHEAAVNAAAFSADGSILATAGDDGLILLWTEEQLSQDIAKPVVLRGHKGKIVDLEFSHDGKF